MAATATESNPQQSSPKDADSNDELHEIAFAKRGCCFWLPCFGSSDHISTGAGESSSASWELIRPDDRDESWWSTAFMKFREWSELVAGPRWKTFIRRFNKNHRLAGGGKSSKFQYDPLSYALNFDEGPGQNGHFDDDMMYRDFSSRFASLPVSAKSSIDWGKDGPSFL